MKQLLIFMAILLSLACSNDSSNSGGMAMNGCGVTAKDPDRFGYLSCKRDTTTQPPMAPMPLVDVVECPDHCPGVTPACVSQCETNEVPDGSVWTCPCDSDSCWRVLGNVLQFCPGCGDGAIEGSEQCDNLDLGGATCQSLGCTGGTPSCTATCTLSNTTCTGCP